MATITLSTCTPAMRSAASTASRTAASVSSMSTSDAGLDAARTLMADAKDAGRDG